MKAVNARVGDLVWVREKGPGGVVRALAGVIEQMTKRAPLVSIPNPRGKPIKRYVHWSDLSPHKTGPWGRQAFETLPGLPVPAPLPPKPESKTPLRLVEEPPQPPVTDEDPDPTPSVPPEPVSEADAPQTQEAEAVSAAPVIETEADEAAEEAEAGHRWTDEQKDALREAVEAGFTLAEITDYVRDVRPGMSQRAIERAITRFGMGAELDKAREERSHNSERTVWTPQQMSKLKKLYLAGAPDEEIAEILHETLRPGCTAAHVLSKRHAMRLLRRSPNKGTRGTVVLRYAKVEAEAPPPAPAILPPEPPSPPAPAPARMVRVTFQSDKGVRTLEVDESTAKAMMPLAMEV